MVGKGKRLLIDRHSRGQDLFEVCQSNCKNRRTSGRGRVIDGRNKRRS